MDIIKITDKPPVTTVVAKGATVVVPPSKPIPVFKYVKPYIAPEILPKGIDENDYIIEDKFVGISKTDFVPSTKQTIIHNTILINRDYETDAKYLIKTADVFELNKQTKVKDNGYVTGKIEYIVDQPVLWFKDNNHLDELTWIITRNIPSNTTSTHKLKNVKSNEFLVPNSYTIAGTPTTVPPITPGIIGTLKMDATGYDWKITDKNGMKYICTQEDLYLTYYPDRYRFQDSLTLEPLDPNKKQQWIIEQDPKTFKRETLEKVLKYSNGDYLKQIMDRIPHKERFEFYKQIQEDLPPNQRLPEALLFIRAMTNNYMKSTGNYMDSFNAIQYVSRYIAEMAEKVRGDKKGKYLIGGSLLKNMYEDEMRKNPNQNKTAVLKKCVNIIMDNK
jgi:hypothetical protein